MNGLTALQRVYAMALHSEDLSGSAMSDENKQALAVVDEMLQHRSPEVCPVLDGDYSNVPPAIPAEGTV